MQPEQPRLIAERFRVQSLVGVGAIGRVYKAIQDPLDRLVALKVLNPEMAENANARRRFFREARAAARLNHPNVVQIYDFGETDEGQLFLAMEWVPGGSMKEWLNQAPDMSQLIGAFDQLLQGLAAAHGRGVLHRDLKPENVMLRGETAAPERVLITDFGLASIFDATGGPAAALEVGGGGTPLYMAPEQVRKDRPTGPETDIYGVGILLYEMLTGKPPFDGEPRAVMRQHVADTPAEMVPRAGYTVGDDLGRIVKRALRKEPEQRYRSAAEMRADLLGTGRSSTTSISRDLPVAPQSTPGSLVGRDEELRRLRMLAVETLRGPATHVVFLNGQMGMGKSSLAKVLGADMVQRGLMSLVKARCDEEGLGNSGFSAVLEELLGIRGCGRPEARRRLENRSEITALLGGASLDDVLDDLRPPLADSLLPDLDDTGGGRASRFARSLRGAAKARPLMIVLDDLQRASLDDLEVLQHLVALDVGDACALMIVACLDGSAWGPQDLRWQMVERLNKSHDVVQSIEVGTLSEDACIELLAGRLGAGPAFARAVVEQVGTNPRIALAVAELAVNSGHTHDVEGAVELLDSEALEGQVPDDVRSLIRARIDSTIQAMPDGQVALRALVTAAVYGELFDPEQVALIARNAELVNDTGPVHRALESLVTAGMLEEGTGVDEDRLAFSTLLLRREVLNLLRDSTRRRLHRETALLLKQGGESRQPNVVKGIAHHLFAAGEDAEGLVFLQRAAELTDSAWMLDEAGSLYEELLDRLGGEESPEASRAQLALGRIYVRQGKEEEAREMLVALPGWAGDQVAGEAALVLADMALTAGNTSEASAWLMLARDRMPEDGPAAHWMEGEWGLLQEQLLRTRGDLARRIEHLEKATRTWPEGHHRIRARSQLAMALARGGRMEEGELLLREVEENMPADAPPWLKVDVSLNRAIVADIRGDEEDAFRLYAQVRDKAREAGDPERISKALVGLAEIARARAELEGAEKLYLNALEIQRRMGHQRFTAITLVNLCMVALARGDLDEADRYLDEVVEAGADVSHPEVAVVYAFSRALVAGRRGDLEQARSEMYRFQAVNSRVHLHEPDIAEALEELGRRFRLAGDEDYSEELTEQAASMWQQLGRDDRAAIARDSIVGARNSDFMNGAIEDSVSELLDD